MYVNRNWLEKVARIKQRIVPLQSVFSKSKKCQQISSRSVLCSLLENGIRNSEMSFFLKIWNLHVIRLHVIGMVDVIKKANFCELDRRRSKRKSYGLLRRFDWKGTQRCLCQKYYLIPEQPLDWPLLHSLEIVLGSEYICPLIHSLLPLMICLPILRGSVFQTVMPFLSLSQYDSKQNCA